jgi:NAD(P)-dependent dehydrogenase (short-subunit alcohol dehydrogenase family)
MGKLRNKVAIITGGAGGIGLATAQLFVAEGAKVLLVDLNEDTLAAAAKPFDATQLKICACDVSTEAGVKKYIDLAVSQFGAIDILFANAGIEGKVSPLENATPEDFTRLMQVNVFGPWLAIKYAVPHLKKQGRGSIMLTSSIAGLRGFAGLGPYVASKHAVIGLMRTAAAELGPHHIRVNSINPGPIDNRMMKSIEGQSAPENPNAVREGFASKVPLGRYGKNEEVAKLALFLASDDSSYCSGGVYAIDGGFTAS